MKAKKKPHVNSTGINWRQRCAHLEAEVADLKAERSQYLKALYALTHKDFAIDKKSLLAQVGKGQSLEELIADLKANGK